MKNTAGLVSDAIQAWGNTTNDNNLGHKPTPPGGKNRTGTKKPYNFKRAKMRRKMAAKSRKINRKG